jgi:hypothetical protein
MSGNDLQTQSLRPCPTDFRRAEAHTLRDPAAMSGARVLVGSGGLRVEGHGALLLGETETELVAALDVVGPASLASLRRALRRWAPYRNTFASVHFVNAPRDQVEAKPDRFFHEPVSIVYVKIGEEEEFYTYAMSFGPAEGPLPDVEALTKLIAPLVHRRGAEVDVSIDDDETDWGGGCQVGYRMTSPLRGRTVYDSYKLGMDVLALVEAADGGALSHQRVVDLICGGRIDALVGQKETSWIDFKREGYPSKTDEGRLELAKDVASFANTLGGLIVIGIATIKTQDIDTASAVVGCSIGNVSVQSYRSAIARKIHPPLVGVELFSVPVTPSKEAWVISIPPQPDEYRPFLVHGEVLGGKVNGNYFSIVARRDDEAFATSPQAVHALLAAGRAALGLASRGETTS